jgi:hypothetical protein
MRRSVYLTKRVAVSFEESIVRIVRFSSKGNRLFADKTEIIPDDQFDDYLKKETAQEFLVSCSFRDSYHAVVTVPVVKAGYLARILESEIRKTVGVEDFSFIYFPLGERIVDNKKIQEVFYYAVRNDHIKKIAGRFYDKGKMVKALYPSFFSVAALLKQTADSKSGPATFFGDETVIGVSGTETEKSAFLFKKDSLSFVREFKSLTRDISDLDLQDINMTISYCLQTLRLSPKLILLIGNLSESGSLSAATPVPMACLYKPDFIHCSSETFNDFIIPIASFYAPGQANILSREFRATYRLKNYLKNASLFFVALTVLCLAVAGYDAVKLLDANSSLKSYVQDKELDRILSDYSSKKVEVLQYAPAAAFLDSREPSIQRLLIRLGEMDIKSARIRAVDVKLENETFLIDLSGSVQANTYVSAQDGFQEMVDALGKIEGTKIVEKSLDIEKMGFSIKINYENVDKIE